jgi:hypothetical protein
LTYFSELKIFIAHSSSSESDGLISSKPLEKNSLTHRPLSNQICYILNRRGLLLSSVIARDRLVDKELAK